MVFQQKKHIRKGLSGDNFSGYYIGLKGEIDNWKLTNFNNNLKIKGKNYNVFLVGGIQQQFGRNGFASIRLGAGKSWQDKDISSLSLDQNGALIPLAKRSNYFIDYRVSFGWAFGSKSSYSPKDCSILQYYKEEKSMWKFDLYNIIQELSNQLVKGKLSVEYEQKIGNTPFSVNPVVELEYNFLFNNPYTFTQFHIGGELRYYYNLKKRIREGKTGNNLSANYVALALVPNQYSVVLGPVWGIQRRLYGKMFLDFKLGYNAANHFKDNFDGLGSGEFFSKFKIGLAF